VQRSRTSRMILGVAGIVAHLSGIVPLLPGDLIFTGTPAGVGAIKKGDVMRAHIDGVGDLEVAVV
jgi:fumarylpyruvate hydrolase